MNAPHQEPNPYQAPLTEGRPMGRRLSRNLWAALVTLEGMLLGILAVCLLQFLSGTPKSWTSVSAVVHVGGGVFGMVVGGVIGSRVADRVLKRQGK